MLKSYYFSKNIEKKDIKKINSKAPCILEIKDIINQDPSIISKLDKSIRILVSKDFEKEYKGVKIDKNLRKKIEDDDLYTPQELSQILEKYEEIEKDIDLKWSNLEKATYLYIRLLEYLKPDEAKQKYQSFKSLKGLLSGKVTYTEFSRIYQAALSRVGIDANIKKDNKLSWNEILIDNSYYPVDLGLDVIEYNKTENKKLNYFIDSKKFLEYPEYKNVERSKSPEYLKEEVNTVLKSIGKKEYLDENKKNSISKKNGLSTVKETISIKSKELKGIFKGEILNEETFKVPTLKIELTDEKFEDLKEDIKNISTSYPEVLSNIKLVNKTSNHINMQEVLDSVYTSNIGIDTNITIETLSEEDFNLDFSNVPESKFNSHSEGNNGNNLTFKSLNNNKSLKLPSFKGKFSKNIKNLTIEGCDLADFKIDGTLRSIRFVGDTTINIADAITNNGSNEVIVESISNSEFNNFIPTMNNNRNICILKIRNQNLLNRKILQEITNPNLGILSITNSHVNDIDGLENLTNIAELNLEFNSLGLNDYKRVKQFAKNKSEFEFYFDGNINMANYIRNLPQISNKSKEFISNYLYKCGEFNKVLSKTEAVNLGLLRNKNLPYYIKDAEIIRKNLDITYNPMMIETNNDFNNIDFNKDYLKNGELLLTREQIEYVIANRKKLPQNIRIMIEDVTKLQNSELESLQNSLNSLGINLTHVQILNKDNNSTHSAPYTIDKYKLIRTKLEEIVNGINVNETDIDKFTKVYLKIANSITYDMPAASTSPTNPTGARYFVGKLNTSRNLYEGLSENKCVCAGYADILKSALALVGVESRLISGKTRSGANGGGHAWNQVKIKDENGAEKWYYTDVTWDAGRIPELPNLPKYMLRGKRWFEPNGHEVRYTKNLESVEQNDYDRDKLRDAISKAQGKTIDIPEDPKINIVLDTEKIKEEYKRRTDDMYAKFYGDKDYQREYEERNKRYKSHEKEVTNNGITYKTVENYAQMLEDEQFLLLDKYKDALERTTKYEAGDGTIYVGNQDEIEEQYRQDKEYVTTRNHTFDQYASAQKDLATLGKYGEKVPYIQKQPGLLRNIGRGFLNFGIFTRNLVSPVYRFIGKNIAQPIHRLITRGKESSPYRNNIYHRMVARRDYFQEKANLENPSHNFTNGIKARFNAFFKSKEGNMAVLRAGAADIRENIEDKEMQQATINSLNTVKSEYENQILNLQNEINNNPNISNLTEVQNSILHKKEMIRQIDEYLRDNSEILGDIQTDAISSSQHAIASKEVTTLKTTVIKGVLKGVAVKYTGPKIKDWLLERGKTVVPVDVTKKVPVKKQKWVPDTYKDETTLVSDTTKNIGDIMSANKGKSVTGFYSVYGGERKGALYKLTGNEKITAIFKAEGKGGTGLSDISGLKAPTLTDRTFVSSLLDSKGVLKQDVSLDTILKAVNSGKVDPSTFGDFYVSVGDRYWTKLSNLVDGLGQREVVNKVIDVAGHYEDYIDYVDKIIHTTKVVTNPKVQKAVDIGTKIAKGGVAVDSILDVAENLRKTTTDVKSNKKKPRKYNYENADLTDIPQSRRQYKNKIEEEEER